MKPLVRLTVLACLALNLLAAWAGAAGAAVRISQIYTPGGGGGGGGGYASSYIELHNSGGTSVSLDGWSIQYAEQGGGWGMTPLTGSIAPGQYYLIQQGNNGPGTSLPTPDAIGVTFMVPSNGKVALVSSQEVANGCANGVPVVDFVGYGSIGCYDGSAAAPAMSPIIALVRKSGGCQDTDDNANDFELATPTPRNTSSPGNPCTAGPAGAAQATPAAVPAGGTTLFTVTVTPGINPASTGVTVTGDLSAIGGSSSAVLHDDGIDGDAAPGDNVFSLAWTVPLETLPGPCLPGFTIADAEGRSANASAALQVLGAVVISQIYTPGGSGGGGGGFANSFVELHNRGPVTVSLDGWSVQYSAFLDTTWHVTPIAGSLAPGQYYLVQQDNAGAGLPLPPADAIGVTWMFPAGGKVALVASGTVSTHCLAGRPVADLVGYGETSCWEGSGPASDMSPITALFRKLGGCQDTGENAADLAPGTPAPRNTASPPGDCSSTTDVPASGHPGLVLRGAHPNPAAGAFAIRFGLPTPAPATLDVLDVSGRRVASHAVGWRGAGEHVLRIGAERPLPAGVYLVRLRQGGSIATTRVVIAR